MVLPAFLPVDAVLPQVIDALRQHPALVLQAPTGSGKTTRVAPAILAAGLLGEGRLIMLQPRRVAARACATIMARAMGEQVGETVGYHIRFERKSGPRTRILVVTEGILTRMLASDSMLEGVTCVVLDEFHERSLHTDLALACLSELIGLRDDLRLVVMSATLDAEPVSQFLGNCPIITAEGRSFPLSLQYLDVPLKDPLEDRVAAGLKQLLTDPQDDGGHILVFLPGAPEINRALTVLGQKNWSAELVPLHGSLTAQAQDNALSGGRGRRIILATNIAETSLTLEGVTAVVDTGYHKMLLHDPNTGTDRLERVRISAASATQRAGRAGRTAPGRAVRLWSESLQALLPAADVAEILRADLSSFLLSVLDFHGPDLDSFPFFQSPPPQVLARAQHLLAMLGVTDGAGRLSGLGKRLTSLPLHPRAGAILERAASEKLLGPATTLVAILEERSPRSELDLFAQYEAYVGGSPLWEARARAAIGATERQLRQRAENVWGRFASSARLTPRQAARLVLAGYPDRLCKHRAQGQGVMVGGRGVGFESLGHEPDYFLALELVERGADRTCAKVDRLLPLSLEEIRAVLDLHEEDVAVFDPQREAVDGVKRLVYEDLVLYEKPSNKVSPQTLAAGLALQASAVFAKVFQPNDEAEDLMLRIRFAAQALPEEAWPDVSEAGLLALLPELCQGKRKFEELRRIDWQSCLYQLLSWQQRQLLDREVPSRVEVPSGSWVKIDYASAFTDMALPVLAVRLQELFGWSDTPLIAKGRVPLLCHLLSPSMRPVQVTRDLRSFWNGTYAEVRKELRQRYPKHSWPEDPWTAQAIRGVVRKKR